MTPRLTPERVWELLAAAPHDSGDPADVRIIVDGPRELARRKMALCVASEALARDVLALHDALARVTRERDAAVAARDALAGAVRAECASVADAAYAEAKRRNDVMGDRRDWDGCTESGAAMDAAAGIARRIRSATGAPADVVRGDVVRPLLAAERSATITYAAAMVRSAVDRDESDATVSALSVLGAAATAARAALDAALVRAREKMRARLIEAQARLLRAWTILSESPIADMPHEGVIQQVLMVTHETRDGRAELDAALARAREEIRDAAVKICQQKADEMLAMPARGAKWCAAAIAALPTTGGEP